MSGNDRQYASADARDTFLAAIDSGDWQACMRLALGLTTCGNPLPGTACQQLDLPARSTYGSAARRVLALCQGSMTVRPAEPGETAEGPGPPARDRSRSGQESRSPSRNSAAAPCESGPDHRNAFGAPAGDDARRASLAGTMILLPIASTLQDASRPRDPRPVRHAVVIGGGVDH